MSEDYSDVPEQVRKQVEEAEKRQKEFAQTQQDSEPEQKVKQEVQQSAPDTQSEAESDPRWEDKYKTLQGKYNAEVPRLQSELQFLRSQIADLNNKLAQQSQLQQQQPKSEPEKQFDLDVFEEYGDEFKELAQTVQQQRQVIAQLQAQVGNVSNQQAQTAEQQFWSKINSLVPDWEQQNQQQDFLAWLSEADPVSGAQRQQILQNAQQHLDANRVAAIFKAWPGRKSSSQNPQAKQSLERQVAPTSGASSTHQGQQRQSYTRQDISQFYRDLSQSSFPFKFQGKLIKTQDEAKQIEYDIHAAASEGRIS